jgi:hypothetical protein
MQPLGWNDTNGRESVSHQWRRANSGRGEAPDSQCWMGRSSTPLSRELHDLSFPQESIPGPSVRQYEQLDAVARICSVDYRTMPLQREWHLSQEEWSKFCAAADQIVRSVLDEFSRLQQRYQIRRDAAVAEYIRDRAIPLTLLYDIAYELQAVFPDAPLFMEVVPDPEEGTEHLLISTAPDLPVKQALDRLRQFDEAWWLVNARRAHGQICVDVEIR